jgi:hypothetical protein
MAAPLQAERRMATTVASIRYDTRVLHRFSSQDATPHNTSMPFSFGGPIQDESKLVAQHVRHQKQTKQKIVPENQRALVQIEFQIKGEPG